MVYRRRNRPGWTFQARTSTGWDQLGSGTDDKSLATRIEAMWETLASKERAWDLLTPVLDARRKRTKHLLALYDLWIATKYNVIEMRRRLQDVDVAPLVDEFLVMYGQQDVGENTLNYTTYYLRYLFPKGTPRMVSTVTSDWLTERLYAYEAGPNTLRVVHSTWSRFCQYLVMPKRLLPSNPMAHVEKPPVVKSPIKFYELDIVDRIIAAQPTQERKALFSLLYGSGIERGIAPLLTRTDFNESTHEVRGAGTKTHTRDRMALIAEWAWPEIHAYLKGFLPGVLLFPRNPSTISHWHLETVRALTLPEYPAHNARHHWAVRQLRAGAPVKLVQDQLGHASPTTTLKYYGPFLPTREERARWERTATKFDAKRRKAAQ